MKNKFLYSLPTFAILFLALIASAYFKNTGLLDPDRYYHFAISKLIVENRFLPLESVPAPVGIGWDKGFPEKEFLFHIFSSIAYFFGKEAGIQYFVGIIFCFFNLVLFKILKNLYSTKTAVATFGVFFCTQSHLFIRMNFVRPHTLAITLFFILILNLIKKPNRFVLINALICFLFTLSYHGFYLLLPPLFLFLYLHRSNKNLAFRTILFGMIAILCGIILNPYFPGNVAMSLRHIMIALFDTQKSNIAFGNELIPWRSDVLLRQALWAVMGLTASRIFYTFNKKENGTGFELVWVLSCFFWILTLLNPRAQEFAIPLTLLSMGQIFAQKQQIKLRIASALMIFIFSFQPFYELTKTPAPEDTVFKNYTQFLMSRKEEGVRIYNSDWDASPYIMYAKPSFKFIDLLDPSFLLVKNPTFHDSREKLKNGFGIDPYGLAKTTFAADWLEARSPALILQLEHSPDFLRLYPEKYTNSDLNGYSPFIFSLNKTRKTHFFYEYSYIGKVFEKNWVEHSYLKWKPQPTEANLTINLKTLGEEHLPPPFFDINKAEREQSKDNRFAPGIHCTYIVPKISEKDEIQKADILGIGGGRIIQVWVDERPVFISDQAYDSPRLISNFIKLKNKITRKTKIEAMVCSSDESAYMGIAMSLWKIKEIEAVCKEKGEKAQNLPTSFKFEQTNMLQSTCIAPFSSQRNP